MDMPLNFSRPHRRKGHDWTRYIMGLQQQDPYRKQKQYYYNTVLALLNTQYLDAFWPVSCPERGPLRKRNLKHVKHQEPVSV